MRELLYTKIRKLMNGMRSLTKSKLKLDDIIDISDNGSYITINVKKDMLLQIEGNVLTAVKGLQVSLAKEIHLNPNIPKNMSNLNTNIEFYKEEQIKLMQKAKQDCNCKGNKDGEVKS